MKSQVRNKLGRNLFAPAFLALASLLSIAPAGAVMLTFEGVAPPGDLIIPATPYTELGFTLTNLQGGDTDGIFDAASAGTNTNGTAIFGWCSSCVPPGVGNVIELTQVGGGAFSLITLDAANLQSFGATLQSIVAVGNLMGGGTVTQTLSLADMWTTFAFSGFTSLASVDFYAGAAFDFINVSDPAFDNINLNVSVPEPATYLLLALGLFGFLGYSRSRPGTAEKI